MGSIYRNRFIFNQRGGSIDIDNTTEQEKIKLTHRNGSNVALTTVVNSELAVNNKQVNVINDYFETVGKDKHDFTTRNYIKRTGANTYNFKGFVSQEELNAFKEWKDTYTSIAQSNSKFRIMRGGFSYPNGVSTPLGGSRDRNPTLKNKIISVENEFKGYKNLPPIRNSKIDEVVTYSTVESKGPQEPASIRALSNVDIECSAGESGSRAPGVLEFGPEKNAATENGNWDQTSDHAGNTMSEKIISLHKEKLVDIEQKMGKFGDDIEFVKRHKFEQVGVEFNDFPSVKIDEKGRSQPLEMLVSDKGPFKNHDYAPHVEDVDNSSLFPCGNDDKVVSNRYSRKVGSGGIQLKTTGGIELGGTSLKVGFVKANINASHGVQIASESYVELQSVKSIILRTNRQVYVESSLGVKGNLIVGGGIYTEGELYCHHITAPIEVHETEDTTVFGKFATDYNRRLLIAEANILGNWFPVYAIANDDLIVNYPHSHHHNGLPIRLMKSNKDVREAAMIEGINKHGNVNQSLPQEHVRKTEIEISSPC